MFKNTLTFFFFGVLENSCSIYFNLVFLEMEHALGEILCVDKKIFLMLNNFTRCAAITLLLDYFHSGIAYRYISETYCIQYNDNNPLKTLIISN